MTPTTGPECAAKPSEKSTTPSDRRATVRYSCDAETSCQVPLQRGGEPNWSAHVRDISVGGVGLVLGRWFGEGTLLEVEFPSVARLPVGSYLVRVRHASRQGDGTWFIGAAFLNPLSPEDLEALR